MQEWLKYLPVIVLLLIFAAGCQEGERPFNQCRCAHGVEERGFITFQMEGEEEKLQGFVTALQREFGIARLTFLHFPLEQYDDFFRPESRAIDPRHLFSPFGLQKIMVWDQFCRPEWFPDTLQMSVQIQEKRMGKRPIDPYACTVELRLRNTEGRDLLGNCREARPVTRFLQGLVETHLGPPHDTTPDPDFPAREREWLARKAAFERRVRDFLDPGCYPAVSHFPGANAFRLQLCEHEGMTDTLRAQVEVVSPAGDPLPFLLYDIVTDSLTDHVRILDGVSGYRIHFQDVDEVAAILFRFPDARVLRFYEKGDFTRYPLPYKPRYSPEYIRKRKEEELNEQLRPRDKVMS